MALPWLQLFADYLDVSSILNDMLDTTTPKDVSWVIRNPDGTTTTITKPNLAKIMETYENLYDELKQQLIDDYNNTKTTFENDLNTFKENLEKELTGSYYTKTELDNLVNTELIPLAKTNVMSFEAYQAVSNAIRLKLRGSGFLKKELRSKNTSIFTASTEKNTTLMNGDIRNLTLHINGKLFYLENTNGNKILYPKPELVTKTITNYRNTDVELNYGDQFLLTDTTTNLVDDGNFDSGIDGFFNSCGYISDTSLVSYDSDNKRLVFKPGTTGTSLYLFYYGIMGRRIPRSIRLLLEFNITSSSGNDDNWSSNVSGSETSTALKATNGFSSLGAVQYGYNKFIVNSGHGITIKTSDPDEEIYITDISVKILEPVLLASWTDVSAGSDLTAIGYLLQHAGLENRDIVLAETWYEKISEKDFVYPYGNVQYTGNDVEGLTGITEGTFTGADTYSLFGEWQTPGELIGKGYVWSQLSEDSKLALASNPLHHIFKIGDEYYQSRIRIRVIKNPVNSITQYVHNRISGDAYTASLSAFRYYGQISVKGSNVFVRDFNKWTSYQVSFMRHAANYDKLANYTYSTVSTKPLDTIECVVLGLRTRYNLGVYHPQYNPYGSSKYYKDGKAYDWWEIPDTVSSLADCLNPDNVAVYNPSDGTYDSYSNKTEADGYYVTGTQDSTIPMTDIYGVDGNAKLSFTNYSDVIATGDILDFTYDIEETDAKSFFRKVNKYVHLALANGFDDTTKLHMLSNLIVYSMFSTAGLYPNIIADDKTFGIYSVLGTGMYNYSQAVAKMVEILDHKLVRKQIHYGYNNNTYPVLSLQDPSNGTALNNVFTKSINRTLVSAEIYESYSQKPDLYRAHTIIGNPFTLDERTFIKTSDGTTDLYYGAYILADSVNNNNGSQGHYYMYIGDDITNVETDGTTGDANASDGHIDFSDTNLWKDLGTDGSIGGTVFNHMYNSYWALMDQTGKSTLLDRIKKYNNGEDTDWYYLFLPKQPFLFSAEAFSAIGKKADGSYIKLTKDVDYKVLAPGKIAISKNIYNTLGYNDFDEFMIKSVIILDTINKSTYVTPVIIYRTSIDTSYKIIIDDKLQLSGDAFNDNSGRDPVLEQTVFKTPGNMQDMTITLNVLLSSLNVGKYMYGLPNYYTDKITEVRYRIAKDLPNNLTFKQVWKSNIKDAVIVINSIEIRYDGTDVAPGYPEYFVPGGPYNNRDTNGKYIFRFTGYVPCFIQPPFKLIY